MKHKTFCEAVLLIVCLHVTTRQNVTVANGSAKANTVRWANRWLSLLLEHKCAMVMKQLAIAPGIS